MNIEIELENTLKKHLENGINLFTGAGFSVLSSSAVGGTLPVGDMLKRELLEKFQSAPKNLELPQLYTFLHRTNEVELDKFIRERFKVSSFSNKYENITRIQIKNIFSTNVDNLSFKIFEGSINKYLNNVELHGRTVNDSSAIDYYYLHGDILNKESKLIFRDLDIATAFQNDTAKWNYLRKKLSEFPTLFWGYSMRDAATLATISSSMEDGNRKNIWIVVRPEDNTEDAIAYYKSLDFKIIVSETENFLDYLDGIHPNHIVEKTYESEITSKLKIPTHSDIEYREISEFYNGSTPTWSDIYSTRVPQTKYFDLITNVIDSGKNVFITGGAATGKSTLLMQLAAMYQFNGVKIFVKDITAEHIKLLINSFNNNNALIFIDDCQSSLDAIATISKSKNVRFVSAERDYAYLSSSNYEFFTGNIEVIDVTTIDDNDAKRIFKEIPNDIRKNFFTPRTDGDSVFEIIEKNCKRTNIKSRFNNIISQLANIDIKLVEMFILVCYVHKSRSIATIDIVLSYFGDEIKGYQEAYSLIEKLGSSLKEYNSTEIKINQDAFLVRSNILADLISERAPSKIFSLVLYKFHDRVGKFSIPNYNVFKRKAYDAGMFERAFPDVNDGIKIYDLIFKKYPTPFNLQQKALYLSRRGHHTPAFQVIDEAVSIAGTKNWAIKNSFAIIKFRANIDKGEDLDVRQKLEDSLLMLEDCISSDIRKAFHAMTFADHALRYMDKYRDSDALRFLLKARDWLENEKLFGNKVDNVRRLLSAVNTKINRYAK